MLRGFRKYFLICFFGVLILSLVFSYSSYADGAVQTTLFGNLKDDGKGCGVFTILGFVVDLLSLGVGILGVISIVVMGIQYLTARGNEEQVIRAKKRLFAIILGIVAYVLMYAGLQFLMPGGKFNTNQRCETMTDKEYAQMKVKEEEKARAKTESTSDSGANIGTNTKKSKKKPYEDSQSYKKCMKYAVKVVKDKGYCKITNPAERISKVARLLAGSWKKPNQYYLSAMKEIGSYNNGGSLGQQKGNSCDVFVHTVLRASGVDPKVPNNQQGSNTATLYEYFGKHPKKWKKVKFEDRTEGDVTVKPRTSYMGHTSLVIRDKDGKLVTAEASNPGKNYSNTGFPIVGKSLKSGSLYNYSVWRYIGN